MSILLELRERFRAALAPLVAEPQRLAELLDMVQQAQDPKFGDYQANLAMPLGKQLRRPPREVAAEIVARLDVAELCLAPEIAGPGFINLRLREDYLAERLTAAVQDPRLGIPAVERPKTYVIDYSAPNVAKPMHVGHIRSTVIGDSLCRMLKFLGHRVISDNHLGDWGTQFGMILYGYKSKDERGQKDILSEGAYRENPVQELARVYRVVRQLMDYFEAKGELASVETELENLEAVLATRQETGDLDGLKALERDLARRPPADREYVREDTFEQLKERIRECRAKRRALRRTIDGVESDPAKAALARHHEGICSAVLAETARLHAGDEENTRLWREFMPHCIEEINHVYERLHVSFDYTLGESFYHDRLADVVQELDRRGIAVRSEGARIIRRRPKGKAYEVTTIVQKSDDAFTYATTDLATLRYRMERWNPDGILYVVDHRQKLHFELLFDVAPDLGCKDVELEHVSFGTVLGEDGRPFKTREGDTVGLEGLLNEAVRRAAEIVSANDDAKPGGAELSAAERQRIAETVGIAAIKYADLSQNRTSDYVFSYDKMLAMTGNTATYMQYAYARVRSIFAKGGVDVESLRASAAGDAPSGCGLSPDSGCGRSPDRATSSIRLDTPAERALGLEILRFGEALELALADYRPNQLTAYLFELANCYSTFFESCPVLRADSAEVRQSRLLLCDLTARALRQGLELLGINVVDRM